MDNTSDKESSLKEQPCPQNNDHTGFYPIKDFGINDLPNDYKDKTLLEIVYAYAALTVRIYLKNKSPSRASDKSFQSEKYSEEDEDSEGSAGTGYIHSIFSEYKEKDKKRCQCVKCRDSPENASTEWWLLTVYSAHHVVFDDFEAKQARCRLFFDEEPNSKSDSEDVALSHQESPQCVFIDGYKMIRAASEDDRCRFVCATCHSVLVHRLKSIWTNVETLNKSLPKQYVKGNDVGKPCFIVSHPHRRAKHVTVGKVISKEKGRYKYDNATCKGSSGAPVYIVGKHFNYFNYVHCEKTNDDNGKKVGLSSKGYNRGFLQLKTIHFCRKGLHRCKKFFCFCRICRKQENRENIELRNPVQNDTDTEDGNLRTPESVQTNTSSTSSFSDGTNPISLWWKRLKVWWQAKIA